MKPIFGIILLSIYLHSASSQNQIADSLKQAIFSSENDSIRQVNRVRYTQSVKYQPEFAKPVLLAGIEEMKQVHNFYFLGELNHCIGIMYANCGETENAISSFQNSLNYRIFQKDTMGMASSYLALSNVFRNLGEYDKAVSNALESERIYLKLKDHESLGRVYNSLGLIFRELSDSKKALFYLNRGLIESELAEDVRVKSGLLENMGGVYRDLQKYDSALYFQKQANQIMIEGQVNPIQLGASYGNLGLVYMKTGELDSANVYLNKALAIFEFYNYKEGIIEAYTSLGDLWNRKGNFTRSLKYYKKGEEYTAGSALTPLLVEIYFGLAKTYSEVGRYKESSHYFAKYINLKDSLFGYEQSAEVQKREIAVQFEKKQLADSLKSAEEDRLLAIETGRRKQLDEEKLSRQRQFLVFVGVAFLIVLVFVFFLLRNNKKQLKLNEIINQQKSNVEEKNREITDSINYARRIQEAILPPQKLIANYFPESFVFYRPKDIVAGDFYWLEERNGWYILAAADCTGHGVPGAMVSVVCANALNRAVKEFNLIDPGLILNKVRELVIETFEKSDQDVKDGMDISLCAVNMKSSELMWAGANNPLWVFRIGNDDTEPGIIDLLPDRQPVGKFEKQVPFTTHHMPLMKNDRLYLFTDGLADQFGGPEGKKFKAKRLKALLSQSHSIELIKQLPILAAAFDQWKGECEQIDDVCLIGLKV
jgi:serine phosphatase RsbU (regulator of sigma subunit)/lipopolysaccharide biosynthesis regulator YciM